MSRPGRVETLTEARRALVYQWTNPWNAGSTFIQRILINNSPLSEIWTLLILPMLLSVGVVVLLFAVAGRDIRLEPGTARKLRSYWSRWRRAPQLVANQRQSEPRPHAVVADARRASAQQQRSRRPVGASGSGPAPWWAVFKKELRDLWVGGRALNLTIAYTVVVGVYSYMMAQDSSLSLVPPKEMVYELLKVSMVVSVFMGLIIGADSLSGERERATLEGLLLTPAKRNQIVVGKFLAAVSPWPLTLIMTVPYLRVLAQGDEVFGQAVFWTVVLGTVLTLGYTALGMVVSFWCSSNKTSMFVTLCLYLLFMLPTQLPGHAQAGFMGQLVQWLNPMGSPRVFLSKLLVNNRTLTDMITIAPLWTWLLSPVVFAALALVLLFWYAGPGLGLDPGRSRKLQWSRASAAGVLLLASLVAFGASAALAAGQGPGQAAPSSAPQQPLQVSIDLGHKMLKAGDSIFYKSVVTNSGAKESPPLALAMNIINLNAKGDVVDPEDWSPERTQHIKPLAPGQSGELSWRVNAILDGEYMVYMVVVPKPDGPEATSHPVASSGIHLTVTPFTRLNPGGVIPYAVGGPVVVLLGTVVVRVIRRRQIDHGGPK
jgi:ABC-type transport system involved in cytochrome c biogenesis permease component